MGMEHEMLTCGIWKLSGPESPSYFRLYSWFIEKFVTAVMLKIQVSQRVGNLQSLHWATNKKSDSDSRLYDHLSWISCFYKCVISTFFSAVNSRRSVEASNSAKTVTSGGLLKLQQPFNGTVIILCTSVHKQWIKYTSHCTKCINTIYKTILMFL